MMTASITKPQAEALAALVHALRDSWDVAGIMAALAVAQTRGDAFAVAHAALYAAENTSARTPGVINFAGEHWTRGRALGADAPIRFERCPEPGHTSFPAHNCSACAAETRGTDSPSILTPPTPEQIELTRRGARTVRAALARHTTPTERNTP